MEKTFKITRQFLSWRRPGDDRELGRVELVGPYNIHDPDPFTGRTAEDTVIPAGCVLSFLVEENDPLLS